MKTFLKTAIGALRNYVDGQHDGNVRQAAKALGMKTNILYQWLAGTRSPSLLALGPVFDAMGITLDIPGAERYDFDYIPNVAARAGAGSSLETSGETIGLYAFRKDFIVSQGIHPKSCILLDVTGDSMEPILKDGDTILVDTSDTEVRDGKTYLVAYGDDLRVKTLFKSPRGLILRSENQRYADVLIEPADLGTYAIIHGRVRWYGRMM